MLVNGFFAAGEKAANREIYMSAIFTLTGQNSPTILLSSKTIPYQRKEEGDMLKMRGVGGFSPRGAVLQRDWTKGSIAGNLWTLAWPIVVTQTVDTLGPIIDMIWVGKLGAASMAGVGVAGMIINLISAMMTGLTTGMRAMVARFVGADDAAGANHSARQAFVISAGFAMIVATTGIFFSETILILFGLEADVVAQGAAYMRIMFVGSATMSFRQMADGMMQASGDSVTPMRIAIFYQLFHVAFCPFLIFGWWFFPRLGVSGAALTNIFSQSLALSLGSWMLFSGRTRLHLTLRGFRLDPSLIWRIVKISLPASVMNMERSFSHLVFMRIVVGFGTLSVAAYSVIARIQPPLVITPSTAVGKAAGVLVGQNLGAGQPERAERSGWLAAGFIEAYIVSLCLVILLWTKNIIGIFSPDPRIVEIGTAFIRISMLGFLVVGFYHVLRDSISGAGDTLAPMVIALIGMWGVEIPLAYFLPRVTNLGVFGVPWAVVIGQWLILFAYLAYFKAGRWKRKGV